MTGISLSHFREIHGNGRAIASTEIITTNGKLID
jgi:hypothetical protein